MVLRSLATTSLVTVAALIPVVVVASLNTPTRFGLLLGVAVITALVWEAAFAALRRAPFSLHGITTALIVCVLIPDDLPVWQLVLTLSLGVILGEQVFGGRGFGFLNAATVTLSFLVFSFPQVELAPSTETIALATLPAVLLLLAFGLIAWRVLFGVAIGVVITLMLRGYDIDALAAVTALAFGTVFLIADPIAASATNTGRWIYGGLAGAVTVLLSGSATLSVDSAVFASLIAGIFAPMIDHLVVLAHARRRRVRYA